MTILTYDLFDQMCETAQKKMVEIGYVGRLDFVTSLHCVKLGTRRKFPASKHRSRRILKKLINRYGGEFYSEPTAYKSGDTVFIHPVLMDELRKHPDIDYSKNFGLTKGFSML